MTGDDDSNACQIEEFPYFHPEPTVFDVSCTETLKVVDPSTLGPLFDPNAVPLTDDEMYEMLFGDYCADGLVMFEDEDLDL